jgi:hypothetical protein
MSALCVVLSPPTVEQPSKPVVVAAAQVITAVNEAQPQIAQTEVVKKDPVPTAAPTEGPAAASSTPDEKTAKEETKEAKSVDKEVTKNEPVKKMYCN